MVYRFIWQENYWWYGDYLTNVGIFIIGLHVVRCNKEIEDLNRFELKVARFIGRTLKTHSLYTFFLPDHDLWYSTFHLNVTNICVTFFFLQRLILTFSVHIHIHSYLIYKNVSPSVYRKFYQSEYSKIISIYQNATNLFPFHTTCSITTSIYVYVNDSSSIATSIL